jgi:hypothetical protein
LTLSFSAWRASLTKRSIQLKTVYRGNCRSDATRDSERLTDGKVSTGKGQKRAVPLCLACPIIRTPNFSASPSDDKIIDADILELFASRPLGVDELFADPIVRMRIGMLITRAINKPTRPQRRLKSR